VKRQALHVIHQAGIFSGNDFEGFVGQLDEKLAKIEQASEIIKPSYLQILLKFFIVNFRAQLRQNMDQLITMAAQLMKDIQAYFGHDENFFSIVPRAVILETQCTAVVSANI
jgi:isopenicillin N synthase-like dioxygenase